MQDFTVRGSPNSETKPENSEMTLSSTQKEADDLNNHTRTTYPRAYSRIKTRLEAVSLHMKLAARHWPYQKLQTRLITIFSLPAGQSPKEQAPGNKSHSLLLAAEHLPQRQLPKFQTLAAARSEVIYCAVPARSPALRN